MMAGCCALIARLLNVLMELMITPLRSLSCQDAILGLLLLRSAAAVSCWALLAGTPQHTVL